MIGNLSAGSFLTELYMCSRANDLRRFGLGPFAHSTTYNDFDLTGSTWQASTFAPQAIPGLGFAQDLGGYSANQLAAGGDVNVDFAFINGGPAFAPAGGFIFKDSGNPQVIGATQICGQNDNSVSYRMTFKQGVDVGQEVPDSFSVGRMARVTLPELMNAGAKRFTWVHKEWASQYFPQLAGIEKGGFLYEVNDGTGPTGSHLEFYERTGYCDSEQCSGPWPRNGGGVGMASMSGGGGPGRTITIRVNGGNGGGFQVQ